MRVIRQAVTSLVNRIGVSRLKVSYYVGLAIFLTGLSGVIGWVGWIIISDYLAGFVLLDYVSSRNREDPSQDGPIEVILELYGFTKSEDGTDILQFDIAEIDIFPDSMVKLEHPICLERVYVDRTVEEPWWDMLREDYFGIQPTHEFEQFCSRGGGAVVPLTKDFTAVAPLREVEIIKSTSPLEISNWPYADGEHAFPFDVRYESVLIWLEVTTNGKPITVAPEIFVTGSISNWHEKISMTKRQVNVKGEMKNAMLVMIELQRPLGIQVLTFALLIPFVALIFAFVFVTQLGDALQLAVAILLGLWGVQEILTPPYIQTTTVIHLAVLLLYMLFAWAVAIRFLGKPFIQWVRKDRNMTVIEKEQDEDGGETETVKVEVLTVNPITTANSLSEDDEQESSPTNMAIVYSKIIIGLLATLAILVGALLFKREK